MTTVHSQLTITNAHKIWDTCRAYIGTELVAGELLATSTDAEEFSSHTHRILYFHLTWKQSTLLFVVRIDRTENIEGKMSNGCVHRGGGIFLKGSKCHH